MNPLSNRNYLFCFLMTVLVMGCSKESDNSSTLSVVIPKITGPVKQAGVSVIRSSSTSLLISTGSACSGCSQAAQVAYDMANNFLVTASTADANTCVVQALINGGYVKPDGTDYLISPDPSAAVKISAQVSNSVVTSYSIHVCMGNGATQNALFISGATGADGTTTATAKFDESRNPTPGTQKSVIIVSGGLADGSWTSKTVDMTFYDPSQIGKYAITQNGDNMIVKGSVDGTVDYQMYSQFKLLGDSASTYALDQGSSKMSVGGGSDAVTSWNSDGQAGGSAYATEVTAGTYFPLPTFSGTISGSESWDCSRGSATVVDVGSVSSTTQTALEACSH